MMSDQDQKSNIEATARHFVSRLRDHYDVKAAWLYGSHARRAARPDSDVDLAVLLGGRRGDRTAAAVDMAGVAFDLMLETGILVDALPIWDEEWKHPDAFTNPALLANIRRDGLRL